jgi:hypothetical protein
MIELLILINLCRKIGVKAKAKGHKGGYYKLLLVLFWFGAEIGSGFAIALCLSIAGEDAEQLFFLIWLGGIAGAALGAWGAFKIVDSLPDLTRDDSDDDYDHYDDCEDDRIAPRIETSSSSPTDPSIRATRPNPGSGSR